MKKCGIYDGATIIATVSGIKKVFNLENITFINVTFYLSTFLWLKTEYLPLPTESLG